MTPAATIHNNPSRKRLRSEPEALVEDSPWRTTGFPRGWRFSAVASASGSEWPRVNRRAARGLSMQEVMLAIGLLGIGMIMVAAVFPVALSQHRVSAEANAAVTLSERARALMRVKIDTSSLWREGGTSDSPWVLLPFWTIDVTSGRWTSDPTSPGYEPPGPDHYGNLINNSDPTTPFDPPPNNPIFFHRGDLLSDLRAPMDDLAAQQPGVRLTWYGFYRETGSGEIQYAAAICRQKFGEQFVEQDLGFSDAYRTPAANPDPNASRRFPMPWRVRVGRTGNPGEEAVLRTSGSLTLGRRLSDLAPIGSQIMVMGVAFNADESPYLLTVPGGRVLMVVEALPDADRIRVMGEVSDLPPLFDVWVFPPAFSGGAFGGKPPVLEWVFF